MFKGFHHHHHSKKAARHGDALSHSDIDGPFGDTDHHTAESESDDDDEGDDDKNQLQLHHPKSNHKLSKLLTMPGVAANQLNSSGMGPLHSLAKREFKKGNTLGTDLLYTFLIESDVDVDLPDQSGDTALHFAVKRQDIDFIRMLLAFGADVNPLNKYKKTPLDISSGNFAFLDHTESLVEIVAIPLATVTAVCSEAMLNYTDEIGTLLKDCGAIPGSRLLRREQKPICPFVDFSPREEKSDGGSWSTEKVIREGDDWCTKISKMYFELETKLSAMLEDGSAPLTCESNLDVAAALGIQIRELKLLQTAGSRILFLDGGGMKGLVQIEILSQIEKRTGRKIIDLFDWIVGTSTGAIIALGLVYAKMSLKETRQLFYKMKDPVFGRKFFSTKSGTEKLTEILRKTFGSIRMDEVKHPRVIVSAVCKKTTNLKLHFFSNHSEINKLNRSGLQAATNEPTVDADIDLSNKYVWEVARYTSAAPVYFDELDDYVDGGVLANNPGASGLTIIQQMYRSIDQKLPISLVVSVGGGQMPEDKLGRTDAHQFMFLGKHWLNFKDTVLSRGSNLITLLGNAITDSEHISNNVKSRCVEQGIDYFRFSPHLPIDEIIDAGETETDKLIDMVVTARKCSVVRQDLDKLQTRFPRYSDANQKMSKRI